MPVQCVEDYIKRCFTLKKNKQEGHILLFRGEASIHKMLIPRIYHQDYHFIEHEDTIFKEVLSMFPELLAQNTTVEKLIIMQHYDFPTRILDASRNPLVGLFFSSYIGQDGNQEKKDGRVYVFSVPEKEIKYCDSDSVSILANLCKCSYDFSIKDCDTSSRKSFNEGDSDEDVIVYLRHEIQAEKPYFHPSIRPEILESVICLRPRMNNPRIIRQDGYFFVYGIDGEKKFPAQMSKEWIVDDIEILKDDKPQINNELDMLNIDEAFLFPDYRHFANMVNEKYAK
jgi:hypothetical protein